MLWSHLNLGRVPILLSAGRWPALCTPPLTLSLLSISSDHLKPPAIHSLLPLWRERADQRDEKEREEKEEEEEEEEGRRRRKKKN